MSRIAYVKLLRVPSKFEWAVTSSLSVVPVFWLYFLEVGVPHLNFAMGSLSYSAQILVFPSHFVIGAEGVPESHILMASPTYRDPRNARCYDATGEFRSKPCMELDLASAREACTFGLQGADSVPASKEP